MVQEGLSDIHLQNLTGNHGRYVVSVLDDQNRTDRSSKYYTTLDRYSFLVSYEYQSEYYDIVDVNIW